MKKFLTRIRIIQIEIIELKILKSDFLKVLSANIDTNTSQITSKITEVINNSNNKYIGSVHFNEFKFRKRKIILSKDRASVKGSFTQVGRSLKIKMEFYGTDVLWGVCYSLIVLLYLGLISYGLYNSFEKFQYPLSIIPIFIFHIAIIFGVPYLIIKKRIKNFKQELFQDIKVWKKIALITRENESKQSIKII